MEERVVERREGEGGGVGGAEVQSWDGRLAIKRRESKDEARVRRGWGRGVDADILASDGSLALYRRESNIEAQDRRVWGSGCRYSGVRREFGPASQRVKA